MCSGCHEGGGVGLVCPSVRHELVKLTFGVLGLFALE